MKALARQPEPEFWGDYERSWLHETHRPSVDPLQWVRKKRTLAKWFHRLVRPKGEPRQCAYCDGPLAIESPETIDHFIPKEASRALRMSWPNLYPACSVCNSSFKKNQWSCARVRPDVDPVEQWFDFDPTNGRLSPAPELDRRTRWRVRVTIRVFGLNATERCTARKAHLRNLENALRCNDIETLMSLRERGPYRFIAKKLLATNAAKRLIGQGV